MSIIRAYFCPEDSTRPTHYREEWWDEDQHEFVVHYGKVSATGVDTAEKLEDCAQAEALLSCFSQQCTEDGYQPIDPDEMEQLQITYTLRGTEPSDVESHQAQTLATLTTRELAWRGLGEADSPVLGAAAFTIAVATVHPGKAREIIPTVVKAAGVQASKVTVRKTNA